MRLLLFTLTILAANFIVKAASVDTLAISTTYLSTPENVVVISPDISAEKPCPSVYLLNGHSGNHLSWLNIRKDLPELADRYGFHIIMPDGRDSWYWNSPVDSTMQMESFITLDLVPYIDNRYNTIPSPDKRAVSGLSMGGHGAMWLAFRHPDIWRNVGAMSGGLDIRPFPENWNMKDRIGIKSENEQIWNDHTVINLVDQIRPDYYNITFDCGTDDFFFGVNNNMHSALIDADVKHDYTVRPGAHTSDYWANSILYHLLFFNENFNKQ